MLFYYELKSFIKSYMNVLINENDQMKIFQGLEHTIYTTKHASQYYINFKTEFGGMNLMIDLTI